MDESDVSVLKLKNKILDEILSRKILLKLKNNLSYYIDGRIIKFSELIRLHSCDLNFDNKLTYENINRKILIIIVEFLEIISWKHHQYTFSSKLPELDCWYTYNKNDIDEIKQVSSQLRIPIILDFFNFYKDKENKIIRENGFFKTLVDIPINSNIETEQVKIETTSKEFENAEPVNNEDKNIPFKIPIKLIQVKLNAAKNILKSKFDLILNDKDLDKLIDNIACDAFWFIVIAFKLYKLKVEGSNEKNKEKLYSKSAYETRMNMILEMLKRLSQNYFNFFIKLCEFGKSNLPSISNNNINFNSNSTTNNQNDDLKTYSSNSKTETINKATINESDTDKNDKRKKNVSSIKVGFNKDFVLDYLYDYFSQCVFYSLYLAFPKSRQKFTKEFRSLLTSFFGYLFNGLNIHNIYNTNHWNLDMGSGNMIEPDETDSKIFIISFSRASKFGIYGKSN